MRMCHFRAQNGPFALNKIFLVQTIINTFIYLLTLFTVQNFKKNLKQTQSYEDAPFLGPKWSNCPNFFFGKLLISFSSTYWSLSLYKIKKKILPLDPELWACAIFGPEMPHFSKWKFFRKTCNEPCFFHSCLSTCQKSSSDINLLVKYWRLKNTEISFLTITWEPDFSQACSFCRMLINLKNFHFTRMPEKTNDHFWPFLVIFARWGFFLKNLALSHTTIYGSITLY